MKVDYTLTEDEELALAEILLVENRHKEVPDRKSANDLIVKILQRHLKIYVDKIKARKTKVLISKYDALDATGKNKVNTILGA